MNYKDFNLGDWIGHISGAIEDERGLDGNEMRDLVEFLTRLPKWIPVSERLPLLRGSYKISDDVLITNGYEIDMGYLVERTGKIFWHYYGSDFEVGIKDEDNDATAWIPLPEPYKESEDKDKE